MFSPLHPHPARRPALGGFPSQHGVSARAARVPLFFPLLLLTLICSSCGSIASDPPPPVTVSVTPGSWQIFAGATKQFSAVVQNASSTAVNWQVNTLPGGNPTVGTIDSSGFYTAPNPITSPLTVTVTAVLQIDPTKTGFSSVTIQPDGSLSISPALSSLTLSQTLQLQVSTPGFSNTQVTWAVDGIPNGNITVGTISAGEYTSPGSPGSHRITATLVANASASGQAQVVITDFPGTLTWRNDNARSGVNNKELVLGPGTVNSSAFGKLFSCPLDGYAYAQPLYVPNLAIPGKGTHNVIFVATEKDSVFAFDADANPCLELWPEPASLIPPGTEAVPTPNLKITSTDIVPYIGITGTPAISLDLSTLYVVAKTRSTTDTTEYSQNLYALDLATGIFSNEGKIANSEVPPAVFSPLLENQRSALLLDNGTLYIAFGSHSGETNYYGWLLGYDAATLGQTGVFNVTPNKPQGGIWQSGGGPSADANHNVYVLTGDGPFDANRGGTSYSNSALRLGTAGALSVADYFSPCNEVTLGSLDFGASAPLLLPDSAGSASEPHLMVGASKDGSLYAMNRDNLGGYNSACPDSSFRVQAVPMPVGPGPILSTPLFWNNAIYVAPGVASGLPPGNGNGNLMSFPMPRGVLASSPLSSQSPETFGPQGATPVLSYNSETSGANGAMIWLIDSSGASPPQTPPRFCGLSIRQTFRTRFTTAPWWRLATPLAWP